MSNPPTPSWTAWPDGSGRWDNRMAALAAQHLVRDLVRPSSGLEELTQTTTTLVQLFFSGPMKWRYKAILLYMPVHFQLRSTFSIFSCFSEKIVHILRVSFHDIFSERTANHCSNFFLYNESYEKHIMLVLQRNVFAYLFCYTRARTGIVRIGNLDKFVRMRLETWNTFSRQ